MASRLNVAFSHALSHTDPTRVTSAMVVLTAAHSSSSTSARSSILRLLSILFLTLFLVQVFMVFLENATRGKPRAVMGHAPSPPPAPATLVIRLSLDDLRTLLTPPQPPPAYATGAATPELMEPSSAAMAAPEHPPALPQSMLVTFL